MKLTTLLASTLAVAAIASPVANVAEEQGDLAAANTLVKRYSKIPLGSKYKPGPSLLSVTESTYSAPSQSVSAAGFTNVMRAQCDRVSRCQSFSGYKRKTPSPNPNQKAPA
ncbi:hypothetical protein EMCG_02136 [[Emmonsia] crescens]|uniref:Uncharacterized protein n=1 Tax=[Emmonsia] crescens TaxID=73230 RepID=A0A0G2J987_9EURO|nr:hypothetical protein EMCG_02136 [Emmonsia crescens UAMH 3008]